ncbi:SusC/RagA family TonB-linked outer membrane protein [Mucilaginibacter sp. RS28]|uniref:SusC/RagA family TonB-linked outer membrane protein n=1 Tax=Mucilaginibacter straminoryzae TaxID=2932774 RepID=A0A9X2B9H6_9SPHI|nr:SusC/RagA family TonB-linked outer membrane protein [Mucilaginibacter straminoryzae]MCJ8209760.1 SusC/RagA family TonB-linked outer membrane protein [Mucilaginibacter straminoryzae]
MEIIFTRKILLYLCRNFKIGLALFLCVCISREGHAQQASPGITLSVKNASIESVFKSITKQSGFVFFYNYRLLSDSKPVTIEVKNANIKQALDACFADQPFSYTIQGKQVTVTEKVPPSKAAAPADWQLKGSVVDSTGKGLDAYVYVRGGTYVKTDNFGHFTIKLQPGVSIVVSAMGFDTQTIPTNSKMSDLRITMTRKVVKLNEVQVVSTGYQVLGRSNIAGSISSLKGSDLYLDGTTTIEQALQGKLPGVVVTNQSGQVGTRQTVRVRGTSTLFGSQDPIWVVDGVIQQDPLPFKATVLSTAAGSAGTASKDNFDFVRDYVASAIGWLNSYDIEDISVLKDASATAIYGVRAANGVIVITTKKGVAGPPSISYSLTANLSDKVSYDRLNLMNSQERIGVSEEIFNRGLVGGNTYGSNIGFSGALNDYLFGRATYAQFNDRVQYLETLNNNWFDILFRTPLSLTHNLSLSGGNANARYYSSFSYNNTNGTAKGNDSKGLTGSVGLTSQVTKKLNLSAKLSVSSRTTDGFYIVDPYTYASKTSRLIPAYNPDGSLFMYANSLGYSYNILNELNNTGSSNKGQTFNANVSANYEIIRGLNFQSLYSISNSNVTGNTYATERTAYIAQKRRYDYGAAKPSDPDYLKSPLPQGGEYNADDNQNTSWNFRNSLSFTRTFNNKHLLTVLTGFELNSTHYTGLSSTTYGYLRDRGMTFAVVPETYTTIIGSTTNVSPNVLTESQVHVKTDKLTNNMGVYGTASYTYDNRYVANFSIRNDRSNRFGQFTEEKFNPVLAGGLRWNLGREKWFDKTSWLTDMSVRGTLGYQRNVVSNASPNLILKIPTTPSSSVVDSFTGDYLLTISSLPYADLRFERTLSMNLGFDFSLFQNKVQATAEYYQKTAKDLVTYLTVPAEYGVLSMPINGGSLTNRGYELSAAFTPVRTSKFTWSVSLNTAKNYNNLVKTGIQNNATWRTAASGLFYKQGYPVSGLWAFDYTGINPANGYPIINLAVAPGSTPASDPTSYMKYVGKADPDFTGGIGTSFRYKMLSLNSSFFLQVGGKKFKAPAYSLINGVPAEIENLSRELLGRWTPTNTSAAFPGLPDARVGNTVVLPDGKTNTNVYEMYNYSTARVVSASMLRCNNISMSYSLPASIVTRLRTNAIRCGLGVTNPFQIVSRDFNGIDPEVATGAQPRVRSYSLNLSVVF